MAKRKLKFKPRRALLASDFRRTPKRKVSMGLILIKGGGSIDGGGYIDTNKINISFPDKAERLEYIQALIVGMGGSSKGEG